MRHEKKPYITISLIVLNIVVFIITEIFGNTLDSESMLGFGALYPDNMIKGEYYRLITSNYLHFGFTHILNNMVVLGASGVILEDAIGHIKFFILYTLSGVGGSILSLIMMFKTGDYAVAAGASGAIFGIVAGLLWVVIKNKGRYKTLTSRGMLFMIVMIVYLGVTTSGTDNWGHIGGLIAGFFCAVLLYRKPYVIPKNIDFTEENQYTSNN